MINMRSILGWLLAFCCFFPVSIAAQAASQSDNESERYVSQGQQAMEAGQFGEARTDFEQLAKLHPEIAEVHATLAVICFKLRDYNEAVTEIRTAQKLKPSLPKLDSLLGLSLSEMDRFTEALPLIEKGFKHTQDPEVRRMCGLQLLRAYTQVGRDSDAVEVALQLNRLYPDDPEVLYYTGRIYGNFAYIVMEKLHDKAPNSVWMLEAQGEANESEKNYDGAIAAFNHVLELDPNRPGVHYRLGRVYLARFRDGQKEADREAAVREFNAELTVDPSNGNSAYELANLDADRGNFDAARKEYQQVLDRFPDFEEALVGLAGIDLQNQAPQQAVPLLEHATRLRPDDEVAWYRLARADRAAGNKEGQAKALAAFRRIHSATQAAPRPAGADAVTQQKLDASAASEPEQP
jgi:tetratricopeptide (TPR) repeat protein